MVFWNIKWVFLVIFLKDIIYHSANDISCNTSKQVILALWERYKVEMWKIAQYTRNESKKYLDICICIQLTELLILKKLYFRIKHVLKTLYHIINISLILTDIISSSIVAFNWYGSYLLTEVLDNGSSSMKGRPSA